MPTKADWKSLKVSLSLGRSTPSSVSRLASSRSSSWREKACESSIVIRVSFKIAAEASMGSTSSLPERRDSSSAVLSSSAASRAPSRRELPFEAARRALRRGPRAGPDLDFPWSDYYDDEMGGPPEAGLPRLSATCGSGRAGLDQDPHQRPRGGLGARGTQALQPRSGPPLPLPLRPGHHQGQAPSNPPRRGHLRRSDLDLRAGRFPAPALDLPRLGERGVPLFPALPREGSSGSSARCALPGHGGLET